MAKYDDLDMSMITVTGIVSSILTFIIVVAVQVLYTDYYQTEFQRKEIDTPIATSNAIIANQKENLTKYAWLDEDKTKVALPIDQAMQMTLAAYSKK